MADNVLPLSFPRLPAELNQTMRTFFPKEYLSRKQTFQKASCAKWPLPSCRRLFHIFGSKLGRLVAVGHIEAEASDISTVIWFKIQNKLQLHTLWQKVWGGALAILPYTVYCWPPQVTSGLMAHSLLFILELPDQFPVRWLKKTKQTAASRGRSISLRLC